MQWQFTRIHWVIRTTLVQQMHSFWHFYVKNNYYQSLGKAELVPFEEREDLAGLICWQWYYDLAMDGLLL
jgi:hypothetical protein